MHRGVWATLTVETGMGEDIHPGAKVVIYCSVLIGAITWISIGIRRSLVWRWQSRCEGIHPVVDWRQTHQSRSLEPKWKLRSLVPGLQDLQQHGIYHKQDLFPFMNLEKCPVACGFKKNCRWGSMGWSLEYHYHHIFATDSSIIQWVKELWALRIVVLYQSKVLN